MPSYAAILGHQPQISTAELAAAAPGFVLRKKIGKQVILFESSAELGLREFSKIGGTVVAARSMSESALGLEDVPQMIVNESAAIKGK